MAWSLNLLVRFKSTNRPNPVNEPQPFSIAGKVVRDSIRLVAVSKNAPRPSCREVLQARRKTLPLTQRRKRHPARSSLESPGAKPRDAKYQPGTASTIH